jgi:hypothetical protein
MDILDVDSIKLKPFGIKVDGKEYIIRKFPAAFEIWLMSSENDFNGCFRNSKNITEEIVEEWAEMTSLLLSANADHSVELNMTASELFSLISIIQTKQGLRVKPIYDSLAPKKEVKKKKKKKVKQV